MHPAALQWVTEALDDLPAPTRVIELGSLNVNGGLRHLFPPECDYIGVDLQPGPGVDVVADACTYHTRS